MYLARHELESVVIVIVIVIVIIIVIMIVITITITIIIIIIIIIIITGSQASLGQRAQVHQLLAVRAPHPLVLEGPQGTLEALLIVTWHRHPAEAQALAYLCNMSDISIPMAGSMIVMHLGIALHQWRPVVNSACCMLRCCRVARFEPILTVICMAFLGN